MYITIQSLVSSTVALSSTYNYLLFVALNGYWIDRLVFLEQTKNQFPDKMI